MPTITKEKSKHITLLLNGTIQSIKHVIPMEHQILKLQLLEHPLQLQYGVLIGLTGDVKGKLVLSGDATIFSAIGEKMFGMAIEQEMLASFSGELGNMLGGGLSTNIVEDGLKTEITAPTILEGNTKLSGYEKAIHLPLQLKQIGDLSIYLLLD
ncbi:chemotaxis protein CheX [Oceanobacillus halophilus]|uniref:Chemotaxis protein CheX n=1 Tax=Oceanobacillus halophilus TaxID=930130 RepID=A0A494ZZW5_9BACI|nr:chemotaxis protein CheX [Oceanobacillus halophilus]RKQ32530.1 chemotaxis protein CheX [Oceanobacillus halophilus]